MSASQYSVAGTNAGSQGRNVFLVSTPIQLLFADMIARQFGMEAEFYLSTGYAPNVTQIRRLSIDLGFPPCRRVVPFGYGRADRFLQLIHNVWLWLSLVVLERSCKAPDRIFLAVTAKPEYRPLINSKSPFTKAYFDEGTATISLLSRRKQGIRAIQFSRPRVMDFFTAFYPRAVIAESLSYFTIYPGLTGAPGDDIIPVNPQLPDSLRRTRREISEIWYIGSPVVQAQLISRERQRKLLSDLRDAALAHGSKLVHFRHRSEMIEFDCPGIEIRYTDLPFEVYFGLSSVKPLAVVSLVSSVIIHMKLFFDGECSVYYLDPEEGHDAERIGMIQSYGATHLGLESLTVPELTANLDAGSGGNG